MTHRDPLIKEIKTQVYHLTMHQPIGDHHENLQPFLSLLEQFFRRGLRCSSLFEKSSKDYWTCMYAFHQYLLQCHIKYPLFMQESIEAVHKSKKVVTEQGRGRCFLRHALQHRFLESLVRSLADHHKFLYTWYFGDAGLLYDDITVEMLSSLFKHLRALNFKLDLRNQSFLDETLTMPIYKEVTLVPCNRLGVQIIHTRSHCVVGEVVDGSVIKESGEVEVGDVVDEMFQCHLRGSRVGTVSSLLRKMKSRPVEMMVVKSRQANGSIFPPIRSFIDKHMLLPSMQHTSPTHLQAPPSKPPPHALLPEQVEEEVPVHNNDDRATYNVTYLGFVYVGKNGSVSRVEESIDVMSQFLENKKIYNNKNKNKNTKNTEEKHNNDSNDVTKSDGDNCKGDEYVDEDKMDKSSEGGDGCLEMLTKENLIYKIWPRDEEAEIRLGETEVVMMVQDQERCRASYTEISACGRVDDLACLFTLIVGETTCTIAQAFKAHICRAHNHHEAKNILCSIAQGFERTHWFV